VAVIFLCSAFHLRKRKLEPMSNLMNEADLPTELTVLQSVGIAYANELSEVAADLHRGLPVLIECDKELVPWVYMEIRSRLRPIELNCQFLDGRPAPDASAEGMQQGMIGTMIGQLRNAVRGAVEKQVVVLPHLDLLTTSQGGLTGEAREVIPLLYENPELVWLGFKDPSFPLPRVIENLFPHRFSLLGVPRDRLPQLITQSESRKFGRELNPWGLYKYVSGMNAAKLRRLLSTLDGEDYPENATNVYRQIRQATSGGKLEIPNVDLDQDIGGYAKVKQRLNTEILDILKRKDDSTDAAAIQRLEKLIPRGMIFWGPPGTGKTLFAKAMATAIGAAITIVSGPELKSRWVGESEENLRQIFHRARQSAPAIIVFDELDSFAAARGTYTGSGVEHSMVNQMLTEMDGFQSDELVFVVGTTNFVESLDPALLRPGRFEFQLKIPYPDEEDRRAILSIYNVSMELQMADSTIEYAVKRTGQPVEGTAQGTLYSGDHLQALCRSLARYRLREDRQDETSPQDIDHVLTEWVDRPKMTSEEEQCVAAHEAGHAVVNLFCEHAKPIDRISIVSDYSGALGFVRYQNRANCYVVTRGELLDDLAILMGGREAERLLLNDISIGAAGDLQTATDIARAMVEEFGFGDDNVGQARLVDDNSRAVVRRDSLSAKQLEAIDFAIRDLLHEARQRAATILSKHQDVLKLLRDELLKRKTIDAKALSELTRSED